MGWALMYASSGGLKGHVMSPPCPTGPCSQTTPPPPLCSVTRCVAFRGTTPVGELLSTFHMNKLKRLIELRLIMTLSSGGMLHLHGLWKRRRLDMGSTSIMVAIGTGKAQKQPCAAV